MGLPFEVEDSGGGPAGDGVHEGAAYAGTAVVGADVQVVEAAVVVAAGS